MATTVQDIVLLKLSQSGCQGKRKKLENLNFTPQLWVQTGDKPIEKKRWSETYNFVYESLKLCQVLINGASMRKFEQGSLGCRHRTRGRTGIPKLGASPAKTRENHSSTSIDINRGHDSVGKVGVCGDFDKERGGLALHEVVSGDLAGIVVEHDRCWSVAITQSATFVALSYAPKDFTVRRNPPELVAPANPTPRELKLLSGIDDQHGLRYQLPFVQFYRYQPAMAGKDPVQVIRKALAKTLVFYYRFAGRLREGPNGKLTVDCDEEGVLFIEADADVAIEQFGDNFMPPFPFFDEILYNVPGSDGIIECPLVLIQLGKQLAYKLNVYEGQVTRLKCGGFTLGFALELVKKAKNEANEEYVHSVADLMATKERSCYPRLGSFSVSDLTKAGIIDVNFGWGKALYI
ncbi:13-hydroxylupanine O-tigloyltransferase [Glycine max]|nr:13-hydroxylupanine O-tigloyltransferase [Glycine max]